MFGIPFTPKNHSVLYVPLSVLFKAAAKKKCVCFSYICVHELNLPRQLIVTRLSNDLIESYHPIANPLWCLSIPFYILDNFASLYLISFYFDIICSVIFDLESLIFLIGWFVGRRVRLFVLLFNHLGFRFLLSCCSDPFFYICSRENEKKIYWLVLIAGRRRGITYCTPPHIE